jgi:hypothetical protein
VITIEDDGKGLDLVIGGVNPPQEGNPAADNPEVHRLFYLGMGRTFEGSIIVGAEPVQIQSELKRAYFEIEPNYYSEVGALPENGDPVTFGEFKEQVFKAAEWMLDEQWKGTLWWGEWWREWDVYRKQGIEATANGNNALGPLYHYWRTGDERFIECGKRSMEFVYDRSQVKEKRKPNEIGISAIRGGTIPCEHSVFFAGKDEIIEIKHTSLSRDGLGRGAIKAARYTASKKCGLYDMKTMLEELIR